MMTSEAPATSPPIALRGYIEGYYGRLLDWPERHRILHRLAGKGMNAYLYAPKEDPLHRVEWRTAWPAEWVNDFATFCKHANELNIHIIGGIAPGLDFDYEDRGSDFTCLLGKARMLAGAGAAGLALMFDDIEPTAEDPVTMREEMLFHADIATRLSQQIDIQTMFVPRVYADEISHLATTSYEALSSALPAEMPVFHCGSHIVAAADPMSSVNTIAPDLFRQRLILWDNFFCNDYCPRRLFLGPHQGRGSIAELMLNGTGMIETDLLLLDVMAAGDDHQAWRQALADNGVPEDIHEIAAWCGAPVMSDKTALDPPSPNAATFAAIEKLLWRWKTPLAREWYPFIFGLKHDLQLAGGDLPALRIAKTQTAALFRLLSTGGETDGPE